MKRVTLATLAVTALVASIAFAEAPQGQSEPSEKKIEATVAKPRYTSTAERWRGRPSLRGATATYPPKAFDYLPSVNFGLQGQAGGAFTVPSTSASGF